MQTPTDTLYAQQQAQLSAFSFDDKVAHVFGDMIERSVPGYRLMLEMIGMMANKHALPETYCYDLGCSLGASTLSLVHQIQTAIKGIIALDNSAAMVSACKENLQKENPPYSLEVVQQDICETVFKPCSVVALNFTLQFIALEKRLPLLSNINQAMQPGGVLILSEKVLLSPEDSNQRLFDLHHDFKRTRGYSELEISQKRNALENVLIPETIEAHQQRLIQAGFSQVDVWFQCFNFISLVAYK